MVNPAPQATGQEDAHRQNSVLSLYLELHSLTESMVQHAADGQWEAVAEVEKARQVVLKHIEGREPRAEDVESVRTILQALSELNGKLLDSSRALRDELAADLKSLKSARKADFAYRNNR